MTCRGLRWLTCCSPCAARVNASAAAASGTGSESAPRMQRGVLREGTGFSGTDRAVHWTIANVGRIVFDGDGTFTVNDTLTVGAWSDAHQPAGGLRREPGLTGTATFHAPAPSTIDIHLRFVSWTTAARRASPGRSRIDLLGHGEEARARAPSIPSPACGERPGGLDSPCPTALTPDLPSTCEPARHAIVHRVAVHLVPAVENFTSLGDFAAAYDAASASGACTMDLCWRIETGWARVQPRPCAPRGRAS